MEEQLSPEERERILQQRAKRFKSMGIPQPIGQTELAESVAVSNSYAAKSTDPMSRLEQIKRGALKKDFQKIITQVESGAYVHPESFQEIPVNRPSSGGRPQNPQKKSAPPLAGFSAARTEEDNEARQLEQLMFGGGGGSNQRAPQQNYYENQGYQQGLHYEEPQQQQPPQRRTETIINEDVYAPPPIDYRAVLEKRLNVPITKRQAEQEQVQNSPSNNTLIMKKLNELESRMTEMVMDVSEQIALKLINEMTAEIATDVAKKAAVQTTKNIILEFGKNGKTILVESAKVKRAEIVAQNKVKIDGKLYKLTEIKD